MRNYNTSKSKVRLPLADRAMRRMRLDAAKRLARKREGKR